MKLRNLMLAIALGGTVASASLAIAADDKKPADKAADKKAEGKVPAKAPDKAAAGKADPTGTWTWKFERPGGGGSFEAKLTLKMEAGKLVGSMTGRNGQDRPIEEAALKGNEVSFKVVRERDGQKFSTSYTGTLAGDAIKGQMVGNFGGEERKTPWEATRAK